MFSWHLDETFAGRHDEALFQRISIRWHADTFRRRQVAVLSVTTFWTFRREFSPLGVRGGKTWYHLKSGAIPINTRAAQKSLDQHNGDG